MLDPFTFTQLIPAGLNLLGGLFQNKSNNDASSANNAFNAEEALKGRTFNAEEAQKGRDWATEMSGTSYQRAVGDMKLAGLNPMLAYSHGGAQTPSSAVASSGSASAAPRAPTENILGSAASTAVQAAQANAQIANIEAQTRVQDATEAKIRSETLPTNLHTGNLEADTQLKTNSASNMTQLTSNLVQESDRIDKAIDLLKSQSANVQQDTNLKVAQTQLHDAERAFRNGEINLQAFHQAQLTAQTALANAQAASEPQRRTTMSWAAARDREEAQKLLFHNTGAGRNDWEKSQTFWGQHVAPYLKDAESVTNSAGSLLPSVRIFNRSGK